MISQKFRFHGHASLNFVFRRGESARSKIFAVKWTKNARRKNSRVAVIVSKKILNSAVKRNRARRRVFEISRNFLAPTNPAIDAVITVFSAEILQLSPEDLKLQLLPLLRRAGLRARKIN